MRARYGKTAQTQDNEKKDNTEELKKDVTDELIDQDISEKEAKEITTKMIDVAREEKDENPDLDTKQLTDKAVEKVNQLLLTTGELEEPDVEKLEPVIKQLVDNEISPETDDEEKDTEDFGDLQLSDAEKDVMSKLIKYLKEADFFQESKASRKNYKMFKSKYGVDVKDFRKKLDKFQKTVLKTNQEREVLIGLIQREDFFEFLGSRLNKKIDSKEYVENLKKNPDEYAQLNRLAVFFSRTRSYSEDAFSEAKTHKNALKVRDELIKYFKLSQEDWMGYQMDIASDQEYQDWIDDFMENDKLNHIEIINLLIEEIDEFYSGKFFEEQIANKLKPLVKEILRRNK